MSSTADPITSSAITSDRPLLVGFDPGKDKCGLALALPPTPSSILTVLQHSVVTSDRAIAQLQIWLHDYSIAALIIGNQTTSRQWQTRLQAELNNPPPIVPVDERNTSLLARDRYWQLFPPRGVQRLLPQGLRQPPRPIDDIVAILLIERYVASA